MLPAFYPTMGRAAYLYIAYEFAHAAAYPLRTMARGVREAFDETSPFGDLPTSRAARASWRVVDELTKRYAKPEFGINRSTVAGCRHPNRRKSRAA